MTSQFYVLSAKVARQASDRFGSETGYLVMDCSAKIIFRMSAKSEAEAACGRLNAAASR